MTKCLRRIAEHEAPGPGLEQHLRVAHPKDGAHPGMVKYCHALLCNVKESPHLWSSVFIRVVKSAVDFCGAKVETEKGRGHAACRFLVSSMKKRTFQPTL